jgi:hypothetical protein
MIFKTAMIMPTLLYERKKKMVRFYVYARVLVCLCALISPMAFSKSVSLKTLYVEVPSDYGLLQTEIHFDERDLEVAVKVKKIITDDLIKVINYFQYVPHNVVHFNVDPYTRLTNGNASTFPTNIINLYNFPPNNSDHLIILEDWLRGLVFHEYTHITHLEQTRGYLKAARYIFGTVATIPTGVVPRWFTEGIAVWSESHLINGGRLNNPLFRKELLIQFMRAEYCETIDCLDEPGVYPGGQLAYWAGSHFIEYLENKKPGTVRCMVEKNSQNIPFNLNYAFKQCADGKPQDLFAEFRTNLIKNQPAVTPESEAWGDKISNVFGSDDLQKGIVLDGNTLFKVEKERKREALVSYDLQENVNMMVSQFRFPIADIVGITTVPNSDNEQTDQGKFLIVGFNEDLNFRGDNHTWKLINTETLLIEAVLPFKHDPSYVIGLGNNRYLTASFFDNKWIIERQKVDLAKNVLVDSEVIYHLGNDVNVTYFKKHGQKVFIKLNRASIGTALYMSELTLESFFKLYESKEYFDIPVLHESFVVLREKDKTKLIELGQDFKKATISDIDKDLLSRVTSVEMTDSRVLVLETRLKTKEMTLKESMGFLKKSASNAVAINLSPVTFQDTVTGNTLASEKAESFPQLYHMLPHYWFLASGSGENTTSIGAQTTFSDPMSLNVANLSVVGYTEEKKLGGSFDFYHKFSSISDLWMVTGFFNHEYSKTDFSNRLNRTTEGNIGTRYAFLMKRWTFFPGVFVGKTEIQDFISNRTVETVGASATLNYRAYSFDDYFQGLTFQMKAQNDRPDRSEAYLNTQMLLHAEGRFQERLSAGLKTSYGKLDKKGFRDGVIYGGGTNTAFGNRWHEFFGLPYSNAYGNEIFTFRGYIDWNFWYIYKGLQLVPIYIKEAHLILGREMLSADQIILDNRRYINENIHSFFIGPRIKMNVAYYIPLDVDVIFSSITKPSGGNVNQVEVTLNADLF